MFLNRVLFFVFYINEVADIFILLHKDMASLSSILEAHNATDKKREDRISMVQTWIEDNLNEKYHKYGELKKILRFLKVKRVTKV